MLYKFKTTYYCVLQYLNLKIKQPEDCKQNIKKLDSYDITLNTSNYAESAETCLQYKISLIP